jgi:hypothetical protein
MADIKFLNNISLENLQLNNAKLQVVSTDPELAGSTYEGRVIYNSTDNAIKFHNGGNSGYWVKLDGSGDISSVTVQAGEGLEVEAGSNSATIGDFDVTLGLVDTVAGDGLVYASGVISVNDDDSTLTIASDVLKIKDGGVTGTQIGADAVDGTKIADDSIDSEHYVDGSIDLAHLAADSVDGTKIADDAIDSEHYTDGSIDLEHLAADSVDGTKIADDSIDSEHYVDGSVDNQHLANDGIIIGSTDVSLGDTITALVGLTDLDLTEAAHTIFDTVGANNLTMGASTTTVVIPGDLQVTGTVTTNNVETVSTSNGVVFEGNAADDHEVTLLAATVTADRTATLPDKTGTLAMTSDISARYFSGLIGDATATTLILKNTGASGTAQSNHGLGADSSSFMIQLIEVSTGSTVHADVQRAASGVVNIIFASAPASNAIRVLMTKVA